MTRFYQNGKYEYCPNGNYWKDVSGIFDKEYYLFCDCPKCKGQVYQLKPFNITKKVSKEQIEKFRKSIRLEEIKDKINFKNMKKIEELLTK